MTALVAALIGSWAAPGRGCSSRLGVWLFWKEDGRHRRRDARSADERLAADRSAVRACSARVERSSGPAKAARPASTPPRAADAVAAQTELPVDVQVKVEQIRRKVDVLLGFADRFPPFSQDLYLVRQTATRLPAADDQRVPGPAQAGAKSRCAGGQTPHQELNAQLDLLDTKLDDIAQDLQRQDIDGCSPTAGSWKIASARATGQRP